MSAAAGIERVTEQIVHDLLPGAQVVWRGREVEVFDEDGSLLCGVDPSEDATPREAVALIASMVQDGATERLWRAVPECVGHAHPAVLRQTDDGVAWVCPDDGRIVRAYVVDG